MRPRLLLAALALGALAVPAQAAPTSSPVDISGLLNTQCQVKQYLPMYGVCAVDDGYGSFIAESMPPKGTLKVLNTDFTWLGNDLTAKDGVMATGQTIPVPGAVKGYKALALLATAMDNDPKQKGPFPFTITYTDGSKSVVTAAVQGWRVASKKCSVPGVRARYFVSDLGEAGCIDFVPLKLDPKKAVKSLTLPPGRVLVQAVSFTQTTSKPKSGPVFN